MTLTRVCENCGASFSRRATPGCQPEAWVRFRRRRFCSHECSRGNRPGMTMQERFMAKVKVDANGCWLWQAHLNNQGYGVFSLRYLDQVYAHRWSYEHFVAPIPDGLQIDHLCRVRSCCNPEHLEPVTQAENVRRAVPYRVQPDGTLRGERERGPRKYPRRQSCSHEMTPANTITRSDGVRWCRTCREAVWARQRKAS